MILKPTRVLENKSHILEMAGLLIELRSELINKYPMENIEALQWALEGAIQRLSLKDGHDYGQLDLNSV